LEKTLGPQVLLSWFVKRKQDPKSFSWCWRRIFKTLIFLLYIIVDFIMTFSYMDSLIISILHYPLLFLLPAPVGHFHLKKKFLLTVLGFEFKALCLLSRCSTT
jgi:hypothetical protein